MAPPTRAATTLTPVEIALWSENSSPRCSAWLCSAMNGDWTTKKAWFAAPMSAAQRTTAGEEPTRSRPRTPSADAPVAKTSTSRRPTRSERRLAGNATTAPAAEPAVTTSPMNAVSKWSDARYRLKSTHQRLRVTPYTSVTRRKIRASRSKPLKLRTYRRSAPVTPPRRGVPGARPRTPARLRDGRPDRSPRDPPPPSRRASGRQPTARPWLAPPPMSPASSSTWCALPVPAVREPGGDAPGDGERGPDCRRVGGGRNAKDDGRDRLGDGRIPRGRWSGLWRPSYRLAGWPGRPHGRVNDRPVVPRVRRDRSRRARRRPRCRARGRRPRPEVAPVRRHPRPPGHWAGWPARTPLRQCRPVPCRWTASAAVPRRAAARHAAGRRR